jgi:hypothetical protein
MAFYSIEQINASTTNPQVLLFALVSFKTRHLAWNPTERAIPRDEYKFRFAFSIPYPS